VIGRNAERTGSSPADFGTNDECTIAVSPGRDMTSCDPSECELGDLYGSLCHPHPSNKAPKLPSVQHHNSPHSTLFQAVHITHPCADNLFIWKKNSGNVPSTCSMLWLSSLNLAEWASSSRRRWIGRCGCNRTDISKLSSSLTTSTSCTSVRLLMLPQGKVAATGSLMEDGLH